MTSTIKIALLAAAGTALLAGTASAQTYQHRAKHVAVHARTYVAPAQIPSGPVYLLEDRGPGARNTGAAENFQDQFNVDY
jgi:hypothetical protein